jgi:hypothetical protein
MSKNILTESWAPLKEKYLSGLKGSRRNSMEVIMENTRVSLLESAALGTTTAGNIATLNRVILPVIRRVMPTVIANELVGVQPMTGPVGQIQTMRLRYANSVTPTAAYPFNTPVTAGDEALSPFKIATAYSGSAATGKADWTANLEGQAGNRVSIQMVRQTVEAKTRKLSASWTFEAAQDAQAMHGIDIENELMAGLAQEITAEIDQEILGSLRALSGTDQTFDQSQVSGTATYVGDEHAALAILINRASNLIAQRTRRGAGNWAVVSPAALTILQSATTSAFARTTEGTFEAPTNVKFAGTLNNAMKIYVDAYASDSIPVLVGYKGSNETDAAAFYCPYIPLMSSGVVLDPVTMVPISSFMTRYGYVELSNTASSFGNASDYVSSIALANISFY